jgi:hypothetical protein
MERSVLTRLLVLSGLLVAAFVGTVVTLNLTLYSASGFVHSYLDSLARHDVEGALAMPGVALGKGISAKLTSPAALGELSGIHLRGDADNGDGTHSVTYGYAFGGRTGTTTFRVEHTGAQLGLFSAWRFVVSPVSVLQVTPLNDDAFDANSVRLTSKSGPGVADSFVVFTPSAVELSHTSTYLVAPKTAVLVKDVGSTVNATVDIRANRTFVAEVQKELDRYLAECVTQKVLLPTGCPMGKQIADRIQNVPSWSMVKYPTVTIVPGGRAGSWQVPETGGTAHLAVSVKSIFDGTISSFDRDVPFTVHYLITFQPDGSPLITAQY